MRKECAAERVADRDRSDAEGLPLLKEHSLTRLDSVEADIAQNAPLEAARERMCIM